MKVRACVIFNPTAGRRRSRRRLARFQERWKRHAKFWPTEYAGHATQLAQDACLQGFTVVAAAGGDGTVHEVANGLLAAGAGDVSLAVVPIGSANDYAYSLARQFAPSNLDDDVSASVDVGVVTAVDGQRAYFIESLGLGLSARVTAEARRISTLQGKLLYALAVYRALRMPESTGVVVRYDDEPPQGLDVLLLSAMLGRREGGFVLAPGAVLDDGFFDIVHAKPMSPSGVLAMLPRIALAGVPKHHPRITLRRCRTLSVQSTTPLLVHTDGEILCAQADGIHAVHVQLQPLRLRVKLCRP
jgi:YegS/Rv2252/BmrU family lipid kinase